MKKILMFLLLLMAVTVSGCNNHEEQADIYTSIYPLEYLTNEIVKDNLIVKSAYPWGADVHDYEIPPVRIVQIAKSKALFYIGSGLEAFIENAENTTFKNIERLVELSNYVEMIEPGDEDSHAAPEEGHSLTVDPHIWLDPLRMIEIAEKILENVISIMPEKEEEFTANAKILTDNLRELDNDFVEALSSDEFSEKYILVDHDAYLYWEDRYDIKRIKTRPDNHSTDVSVQYIKNNLTLIEQYNIKYIAVTTNEAASTVVNQYVIEGDLQIANIHSLATISKKLYEDGYNYIDIMRNNLQVLVEILPRKIE